MPSLLKRLYLLIVLVSLVVAAMFLYWWWQRQGVGYLFDLESIPWSVSSVDCESQGWTDTLFTCAFEIAPSDFGRLLESPDEKYKLRSTPYWKHAHDFPMSDNLGPNFAVAWHYEAMPKDAPHGGSIDVLADMEKRHVLAHLYIE